MNVSQERRKKVVRPSNSITETPKFKLGFGSQLQELQLIKTEQSKSKVVSKASGLTYQEADDYKVNEARTAIAVDLNNELEMVKYIL